MSVQILVGDCLTLLRGLPDESVHCVVTSPPYWGLRSYKGDAGMIGLEPTCDEHLANLVEVFREVRRVLRKDGTCWLNYGDAYTSGGRATYRSGASNNKGHQVQDDMPRPDTPAGLKPKDLMMMPARVALALQADGWWIRSEVVWHKPNPMPESCTDRPTSAHEKLYLLTKSARYFYDAEAVRRESPPADIKRGQGENPYRLPTPKSNSEQSDNQSRLHDNVRKFGQGSNLRNVWTISTHSFSEAHFATFPPRLVEPCIKAGTSERGVCQECGGPWVRSVDVGYLDTGSNGEKNIGTEASRMASGRRMLRNTTTTGWSPTCQCKPQTSVPSTVLDPFGGSGTVALVAQRMNRDAILCEISAEYAEMARKRIEGDAPMFSAVEVQA